MCNIKRKPPLKNTYPLLNEIGCIICILQRNGTKIPLIECLLLRTEDFIDL